MKVWIFEQSETKWTILGLFKISTDVWGKQQVTKYNFVNKGLTKSTTEKKLQDKHMQSKVCMYTHTYTYTPLS